MVAKNRGMFRGLFIGIDRYPSDAISWLSCAERDASALHSLFADTFGDDGELLTSEQATRAAILGQHDNADIVHPLNRHVAILAHPKDHPLSARHEGSDVDISQLGARS